MIKAQDVLLIDELGQLGLEILIHIVFYVLRSFLFVVDITIYQEFKVISTLRKVLGPVTVIDLVPKQVGVFLCFNWLF